MQIKLGEIVRVSFPVESFVIGDLILKTSPFSIGIGKIQEGIILKSEDPEASPTAYSEFLKRMRYIYD